MHTLVEAFEVGEHVDDAFVHRRAHLVFWVIHADFYERMFG